MVRLDLLMPLLPLRLDGLPEVLEDVVALLLLWVLIVFLKALAVMDVAVVLWLVVLALAAPEGKRLVVGRRAGAGDLGGVPLAVGSAAYGGGVSLDEALLAVIAEQRADLISRLQGPEHTSILHHGGLPA